MVSPSPETLLGMPRRKLEEFMKAQGESTFHAQQLMRWLYIRHVTEPEKMSDLSKDFRARLAENFHWNTVAETQREESRDGTVKFLLRCEDGETIESVWIPMPDRATLCVSSQVGCRMGCRFCVTATQGLKRNLTSAEIVAQVLHVRRERPVTNVVFMGMGEPFDNYDNVVSAIDVMLDNFGFNLSARRVTVSTSGIVPRIQQYARECRSQLAVSLNSTTNEVRYELMPVNKRWPIEEIVRAVDESYGDDRRRVTFEYILMRDLNDSPDDARRLAKLLRGLPCKVNLIPYNENPWANYGRPTDETITQFQNLLLKQGYNATIRWSRGPDIRAACGQLKSREGEGRNGSENRDHWGQRALSASGA